MNKTEISPLFSKPLYSKFTDVDTKKIVSMLEKYEFSDDYGNTEPDDANMSLVSTNLHVLDDNKFKWLKTN